MERPEFDRMLTAVLPQVEDATRKYARKYNLFHDWQDIAQSAILKMLRFADQYEPTKGALLPWACVIIINTIKTLIAQSMTEPFMKDVNAPLPAITGFNPDDDLQAAFILSNLNEEARLYVEGYNYREIAARCGVKSKVTVMNRIDKCATRLSLIMGIDASRGRRKRMCAKSPD